MTQSLRRAALAAAVLLFATLNAPGAQAHPVVLTLDGLRDDGYQLLAQDPALDLTAVSSTDLATNWADLTNLYVTTDTTNLWVYVDLPNFNPNSVGEFGLAIDTDGLASSGGARDPWLNAITFAYTSTRNNVDATPVITNQILLPDVVIRGHLWSVAANGNGKTELMSWNGSAWSGAGENWGGITTSAIGTHIGFLYGHGIELSIPFTDLGVPPTTTLNLEFYATGANGIGLNLSGAWDTVPPDAQSQAQYQATTQLRLATVNPTAILPLVSFSSPGYAVSEADGSTPITITVAPTSTDLISVTFTTTDGTAGPADYLSITQVFTIGPGLSGRVIPLQIHSDSIAEPDETVFLGLSQPANAQLGQPLTATLTIHDSPPVIRPNKILLPLVSR